MTAPTTRETDDHIGEANEKVTADHAELARLAEAIGPVEWFPGHLCRDDHPCDCAYVFDDGHAGAVATVHVSNGLPISEGGNDAPEPELAKLHQAFIAAANPATVLSLLSEIAALRIQVDTEKRLSVKNWNVATARATQAERQRDELRKAADTAANLFKLCTEPTMFENASTLNVYAQMTEWLVRNRPLIANQGADQ